MRRRLPFADWMAAQRELKALRLRARMTGIPLLEPLLAEVQLSLVRDGNPAIAGIELQHVEEHLEDYPHFRRSVEKLSSRIIEFPVAETWESLGR